MSVVGAAGKVEALIPASTVRIGRRGEHWIGASSATTCTTRHRPRGPAPRVELPRARPLPGGRPPRRPARGDAGGRAVVRRDGRRRPPQHRARPPRRAQGGTGDEHDQSTRHRRQPERPASALTWPTGTPSSSWRGSPPSATTTTSSWGCPTRCCQLVRALPQHRADRRPLRLRQRAAAVGLRPRHRQHGVRRGDGADDDRCGCCSPCAAASSSCRSSPASWRPSTRCSAAA